jgi:NAD-dependent SIR2 family protein deacetylase
MTTADPARQAAALIAQADGLLVAAGAGMGVDSGLPDFRGAQGFWNAYPALGRARIDFYAIASPASFRTHPRQAWGFYGHRLALYRKTVPHAGFALIKRWSEALPRGCAIFTSNVDGQFQRAGFPEATVRECHGSIHYLQCLAPCSEQIWPADGFVPVVDEARCELCNDLPACPLCGGLARPNILMFGDGGWLEQRDAAQAAVLTRWLAGVRQPVVIEIGAGTDVPSVRHFSHAMLREHGAALIRINPREAAVPGGRGVALPLGALEALAAIDNWIDHNKEETCRTH